MRILFLTDIYQHTICHNRFFEVPYLDRKIIKERLDCDIFYWGPGLEEEKADWSQPLQDQILNKFGDLYYFDIIVQLPGGGILNSLFYSKEESKTLILIHFHEVPKNLDLSIIERVHPHIIFYVSNENALNAFNSKKYINKIIAAFPLYQSIELSKRHYDETKDIDLLLIGNTDNVIYPLRSKLLGMIEAGKFEHIKVYVKPTVFYASNNVCDVLDNKFTADESKQQTEDYIKLINRSKLVLCTSHDKNYDIVGVTHTNFRLRKYAEIGMSSALRIGNVPDEDYYNLEDIIVNIDGMTDDQIIDTVNYWVHNDKERDELVKKQNEYEIANFSSVAFIERIIFCHKMYKRKKYGYYNFTNFCMTYS